jgi:surfeit locus 1 family protein
MTKARTLIAAGAVMAALAVLLGLGTWQMLRRAEKHALIARIEAQMNAAPVSLPAAIADPVAFDYRRVTVRGRYLHGREMLLLNRVRNGVAGVHVITPLVREDGPTVLVDRGWAPLARPADDPAFVGQPPGSLTVSGVARVPVKTGAFTPDNDPARGLWFTIDLAAMAAAKGIAPVAPVLVVSDVPPDGIRKYPIPVPVRAGLRDDHLQYALTWYSLALVLVGVVIAARRRGRPVRKP